MTKFYFNHKLIEDTHDNNSSGLTSQFKELALITEEIRKEKLQLFFCNYINNNQDVFYNKLHRYHREREAISIITSYITNANNFYPITSSNFKIDSKEDYLNMCVEDNQNLVASLTNESFLSEPEYIVNDFCIKNLLGLSPLKQYIIEELKPPLSFKGVKEVFSYLKDVYQNKIEILNNAKKTAKKCSLDGDMLIKIYRALEQAINVLLPHNTNNLNHLELDYKQATEEYGSFDISPESQKTLNKYGHLRTFNINGEPLIFSNHIKIGNNFRIHFYIKNNKLYIGHCGKHLPIASD